MKYITTMIMIFSIACEETGGIDEIPPEVDTEEALAFTENPEDIDTDPCTEIDTNFCVDESLFPMINKDFFLEQLDAFLGCAGLSELPEKVYVRIISHIKPLENSQCTLEDESLVIIGCAFYENGKYTIEVEDRGLAISHELGHVVEAIYGIVNGNDPDDRGHRPCGLAVNCGDQIRYAYKNNDLPDTWPEVKNFDCDWRTN